MPIRWSRPSDARVPLATLATLAALASACAGRPMKTLGALPEEKESALPVDPTASMPHAGDRAAAGDGVVTLRTPVGSEAILALVRRLFDAYHDRTIVPIEGDLAETVLDLYGDPGASPQPRAAFVNYLYARMKAPFDQLDVDQMYRSQEVEIWGRDDLGLPGRPARPAAMAEGDLLVRIPITTPRVGSDVLFGDEIRLLLVRDGAAYRIRGYGELVPR